MRRPIPGSGRVWARSPSSGRPGPSPRKPCSPSPTTPQARSRPVGGLPEVLEAVGTGDGRLWPSCPSRTRSRAPSTPPSTASSSTSTCSSNARSSSTSTCTWWRRPGPALASDHPGPVVPARQSAQCRRFLADQLPEAEVVRHQLHGRGGPHRRRGADSPDTAALAPRLAAELYGLEILAPASRTTRTTRPGSWPWLPPGCPAPTGHDKTSIVCFQREDRPGSLHAILSEFAARSINLTKLESRPTKQGLGNYCFLIDLEGHLADEVVADCLRVLHAELAGRQVPRLLPGRRRPRSRRPGPGRHGLARGRRLGPVTAITDRRIDPELGPVARSALPWSRRDGRADECEALEKPWPKRPGGSNPTPSAVAKITTFGLFSTLIW